MVSFRPRRDENCGAAGGLGSPQLADLKDPSRYIDVGPGINTVNRRSNLEGSGRVELSHIDVGPGLILLIGVAFPFDRPFREKVNIRTNPI